MTAQRRSSLAPSPLAPAEAGARDGAAISALLDDYGLQGMPHGYVVLVEGWTDVVYLESANAIIKKELSVDLLELRDQRRISIHAPSRSPKGRGSGGAGLLKDLALALSTFLLYSENVGPACFLLDHDDTGQKAFKSIKDALKGLPASLPMTLDPANHSSACRGLKGVHSPVVEDLLSVEIQQRFFETSVIDCEVAYRDKKPVRFVWHGESKKSLAEFVRDHGEAQDVLELARVLVRIRDHWNLEVPDAVRQLLP